MGRPSKPTGKARGLVLQERVTRHEMEVIRRAASAAGMSVSAWARAVLLEAAGKADL